LLGVKFSCPSYPAPIGLSAESKPKVEEVLGKMKFVKKWDNRNSNPFEAEDYFDITLPARTVTRSLIF
jgi:hypothetical protein